MKLISQWSIIRKQDIVHSLFYTLQCLVLIVHTVVLQSRLLFFTDSRKKIRFCFVFYTVHVICCLFDCQEVMNSTIARE